jgi:hypothetical protein
MIMTIFIAGVDRHNADPPDPPDANANENHNNEEDDDDEDNEDDTPPDDDEFPENNANEEETPVLPENNTNGDETPVLTVELKKLTDSNGALPPILESRMRQMAQGNNETLVTTEEEEEWTKPVSKKQRKIQRELQKQMLKRVEEENKRKLRNKLKNEKRRIKIKERKKDEKAKEEPSEFGDLRDQLKTEQKPGVSFPHDSCSSKDLTPELEAITLTQYNLKRGLKEFGNDGLIALGKEVKQLYTRKVSKPLTKDQKRAFLQYLMFLTEKRCGKIKARRGCADGRKKRETTNKEDASAPTVSIKAVMLSAIIDAMEERDVATVDIPGAFMQANIDEVVYVKFEGEIAEMLVKLDRQLYRKYVKDENGKPVLYVELLKALWGTLKAALLFWKLLSSKLVSWRFVINPYN